MSKSQKKENKKTKNKTASLNQEFGNRFKLGFKPRAAGLLRTQSMCASENRTCSVATTSSSGVGTPMVQITFRQRLFGDGTNPLRHGGPSNNWVIDATQVNNWVAGSSM